MNLLEIQFGNFESIPYKEIMVISRSISEVIIDNVKGNRCNSVPIETWMLDYDYIDKCGDTPILVEILKTLVVKHPRQYPDLERDVENKILSLLPEKERSKILLLSGHHTAGKTGDDTTISSTMEQWVEEMAISEERINSSKDSSFGAIPPVRNVTKRDSSQIQTNVNAAESSIIMRSTKEESRPEKSAERICKENLSNRDYFRAWDKFDVDAAEKEIESDEESEACDEIHKGSPSPLIVDITNSRKIKEEVDKDDDKALVEISDKDLQRKLGVHAFDKTERSFMAGREKEKGNEFFRSKEFEAAIRCYSKSIALDDSSAILYSNRAMALIRISDFSRALEDCNRALVLDPTYTKALARRGTIHKHCRRSLEAMNDFATCMIQKPDNKEYNSLWQESKTACNKGFSEHQVKRRIVIVEDDDDDDDDDSDDKVEDDDEIEEIFTPGSLAMK